MIRMGSWWIYALVALGGVYFLAPAQLPVILYKVALVTLGVVGGYLADKALFKRLPMWLHIRKEIDMTGVGGWRILARALVVLAVIIGLTVGL